MLKPYKRAQISFANVREIGADGRNSTTHLVQDAQLGAEIVMKTISKKNLACATEFFEESKNLYASSHQNVVQIYYACEDDDHIYVAMPFYSKGSVKGLMNEGHLSVREVIKIGCQLLSGLHNIHSKGLIHFDIKPDNILLSDRRDALLSDFGLAKQMELDGFATVHRLYMPMVPPEVVNGPPYTIHFDIYQVGLTLFRMINGNDDFEYQFSKFVNEDGEIDRPALAKCLLDGTFPDRTAFGEHVPAKLRKVIIKCLEPLPENRFKSALAVANALASVDECLDWRPVADPIDKIWIKNENGAEKRFVVTPSGATKFTSRANGGSERRKSELCKDRMTRREIEKALREN